MNKEFIPYEEALAMKELGFDKNCIGLYDGEVLHYNSIIYLFPFKNFKEEVDPTMLAAPLWQQAFRWFEEQHGLYGIPVVAERRINHWMYEIQYLHTHYPTKAIGNEFSKHEYPKIMEAGLACLRRLIELVKQKS